MISNSAIEHAAYEITKQAAIDIPADYLGGIKAIGERETAQLSGFVIKTMVENYEAATEDRRPMCADTGLPRYYVKVGDNARFEGGFHRHRKGVAQRHRAGDTRRAAATEPCASAMAHRTQQQRGHQRTGSRMDVRTGR